MIISHKHKFVFTRPIRVGSGTVQKAIVSSDILGEEDYHTGEEDSGFKEDFLKMSLPVDYCFSEARETLLSTKTDLIHSTPEELLKKALLSKTQMEDYTFISIIRNPLDRFLSCWVYEVIGFYFNGDSYEQFLEDIEKGKVPETYKFKKPEDYFTYEGSLLRNIKLLRTSNLQQDFDSLKLGDIKLNRENLCTYPEWAREGVKKALSNKYLDKLKTLLSEDIAFYSNITKTYYDS